MRSRQHCSHSCDAGIISSYHTSINTSTGSSLKVCILVHPDMRAPIANTSAAMRQRSDCCGVLLCNLQVAGEVLSLQHL